MRTITITAGRAQTVTSIPGLTLILTDDDGAPLVDDNGNPLAVNSPAVHRRGVTVVEDS